MFKKTAIAILSLVVGAASLTSCGSSKSGQSSSAETSANASTSSDNAPIGGIKPKDEAFKSSSGYDVDLTELSSSMVYAQVNDMMVNPDNYKGKSVRANGTFDYFKDEKTGNEYFSVIIKDATACCAQGIEFVLSGEYSYPKDYPAIGSDITVSGTFGYYSEGENMYSQLTDAVMDVGNLTW